MRARRCSRISRSRVERGTLHALVGPNGAGKTTLLSAILGLAAVRRPHRRPLGAQRAGSPTSRSSFRSIARLPVTVADFLALTRQRRPVCLGVARETRKRIALLLDRVGLGGFETAAAVGVVGRRAAARAAGARARSAAGTADPRRARQRPRRRRPARWLDDTLQSLKGETDRLMVSHDADQVRRVADRVTIDPPIAPALHGAGQPLL